MYYIVSSLVCFCCDLYLNLVPWLGQSLDDSILSVQADNRLFIAAQQIMGLTVVTLYDMWRLQHPQWISTSVTEQWQIACN